MRSLSLEQVSTSFLNLLRVGFVLPNFQVLQSRGCNHNLNWPYSAVKGKKQTLLGWEMLCLDDSNLLSAYLLSSWQEIKVDNDFRYNCRHLSLKRQIPLLETQRDDAQPEHLPQGDCPAWIHPAKCFWIWRANNWLILATNLFTRYRHASHLP